MNFKKTRVFELKISKNAVSDVFGAILILGITVAIFSILFYIVLSEPLESNDISPTVVAFVEGDFIVFEHRGGDDIDADSQFNITVGDEVINESVGNLLLDLNGDNKWNAGEKLYFDDFNYSLDVENAEMLGVDIDNNNVLMMGNLDIFPQVDIGIDVEVDNPNPLVGEKINITITVTNYGGDLNASGIKIQYDIPKGLEYWRHYPPSYNYSNMTGIWLWNINQVIPMRESISIRIQANVTGFGKITVPTQLVMVLDGSGSVSSSDWNLIKEGLVRSICNDSLFPHDGSVELCIIQFGSTRAEVELPPTIVSNNSEDDGYYSNIADIINSTNQIEGWTPMTSGIRLAADQLSNSSYFSEDKRQVVNLVTDGLTNGVRIPGGYYSDIVYDGWTNNSGAFNGSTCAYSNVDRSIRHYYFGDMISKEFDAEGASSITIKFWYKSSVDYYDRLRLYAYDGSNYQYMDRFSNEYSWVQETFTITDPDFMISDFKFLFKSGIDTGDSNYERIAIDDVEVYIDSTLVFKDGFEDDPWDKHWINPAKHDTELSRQYLLSELSMVEAEDEFDVLAVGPSPDLYWLKNSIAWPQPGYIAPPFNNGPGWVSKIDSFQEFENAVKEMFKVLFSSIKNEIKVFSLDMKDPYPLNDNAEITITPHEP